MNATTEIGSPILTACARLPIPLDSMAPKRARAFVTDIISGWGQQHLAEDAMLIASELATNAFHHARSAIGTHPETINMILELRPDVLGIHLQDNSMALPAPRIALDDEESGRGLQIITALAQSWTVTPASADGKQISVYLSRDHHPLRALDRDVPFYGGVGVKR